MNLTTLKFRLLGRQVLLPIFSICLALIFIQANCKSPKTITIGITQITTHPSLDSVRTGIIDGLRQRGYVDGKNIKVIFRNANGDPSLTLPIAQDFVRQNVNVIVPISTPSALGAAKSTKTIPIVFGGVTDPVGAGLVSDLNHPGGNITGTSDRWPFKEQLDFFIKVLPNLKKLGMLYKAGDDVSKISLDAMRELAPSRGIEIIAKPVSGAADVYPSAVSLFRQVDAVYTGVDSFVVENLGSVLKAAGEANKPVLAGDDGSMQRGALAAYSVSMNDLGVLTGKMVADVLDGKHPAEMAVQVVTSGSGIINRSAAEALHLDISKLESLGAQFK
jgi:putative ABC transport system substrate-binding protein